MYLRSALTLAAAAALCTISSPTFAAADILGVVSPLGGNGGKITSVTPLGSYQYVDGLNEQNMIDGLASVSTNYVGLDARPGVNGFPVSFRFIFDGAYNLDSFVLWNDRDFTNRGGLINNGDGVQNFSLRFFDSANVDLGVERFTADDLVNQLVFTFAQRYNNVASVQWNILNFYTNGPAHNCASVSPFCNHQWREVGFNYFQSSNDTGSDAVGGSQVPEPSTLFGLLLGVSALTVARKRLKLK